MITIEHSHADGTVVHGTTRENAATIKGTGDGWRWSRNIGSGAWYLPRSRDRHADTARIERLAAALRAEGNDVEISIDNERRDMAEIESDRAERAEGRVERYEELASARHERGNARYEAVRELYSHIPPGQPIMSARDANYREKLHRSEQSAYAEIKAGDHYAARAKAAEGTQRYRENPRVITRRIERLEADQRRWQRELAEATAVSASPSYIERATNEIERLGEEIAHWCSELEAMEATGAYRAWKPEHFRKGDEVLILRTWYPVLRVNKKSLTVTPLVLEGRAASWTDTAPYDTIYGRRRDGVELTTPPASAA